MVQHGFSDLKKDITGFRGAFDQSRRVVLEEFRRLNVEIRDIKTTLGPTVVIVAEQENRIQALESRVGRVERKVGIAHLGR